LHAPLTDETRHIINKQSLSLMKKDAILINTSRGGLVDTEALLAALDAGSIGCAGLDVFEEEPPPTDAAVRQHPLTVLSDHMGWHSEESQIELQRTVAEEVVRVCRGGLPLSLANPKLIETAGRFSEWNPSPSMLWQLQRSGLYEAYLAEHPLPLRGNAG
jgi:D-3-phosphoglycerate dehydrogenase